MKNSACEQCIYFDSCDAPEVCEWFLQVGRADTDESDYLPDREEFTRRWLRMPPDGDEPLDYKRYD